MFYWLLVKTAVEVTFVACWLRLDNAVRVSILPSPFCGAGKFCSGGFANTVRVSVAAEGSRCRSPKYIACALVTITREALSSTHIGVFTKLLQYHSFYASHDMLDWACYAMSQTVLCTGLLGL